MTGNITDENIALLEEKISQAEAILVGAGAGLSTAAGFTYSGKRFHQWFFDFEQAYGIRDMYSGGFYPFPSREIYWAWWSRQIYLNRYVDAPLPVYPQLLDLVREKEYFVLTTNVDHQFQRAGFDKKRLFYTQGDYGLFQKERPGRKKETWDNEGLVYRMLEAQGFVEDRDGRYQVPADGHIRKAIPASLVPKAPDDGSPLVMNLRCDDTFVEDAGWHWAAGQYHRFLQKFQDKKILYLELGVGMNTPVIIKYPFWQRTGDNPQSFYVCINRGAAFCPDEIRGRSLCLDGDIAEVLEKLTERKHDHGTGRTADLADTAAPEGNAGLCRDPFAGRSGKTVAAVPGAVQSAAAPEGFPGIPGSPGCFPSGNDPGKRHHCLG